MGVRMSRNGPFLDGNPRGVIQRATDAAEKDIGEYAAGQVRARLRVVLQHPTGHYMSRIKAEPVGTRWQVTDSGVVYGPWLESGRNSRRTRFRGYATFRRVAAMVNRQARTRAERVIFQYVRRLG